MKRGKEIGYHPSDSPWVDEAQAELADKPCGFCGQRLSRERKIVFTLYGHAHEDCVTAKYGAKEPQAENAVEQSHPELFQEWPENGSDLPQDRREA